MCRNFNKIFFIIVLLGLPLGWSPEATPGREGGARFANDKDKNEKTKRDCPILEQSLLFGQIKSRFSRVPLLLVLNGNDPCPQSCLSACRNLKPFSFLERLNVMMFWKQWHQLLSQKGNHHKVL